MLSHVFVANRGEIAARIARTCERLGVAATASGGDFLDVDAQVAQALAAGADSVHPGYGFLSENAAFARAVGAAGLVWIGPSPEAMEAMARKDAAREIAIAAGVPVVPTGADASYPVLVKAAAGGGGKGMRVVRSEAEMAEAVAAAEREARAAFGDDTMLVEKYVESGRHVEVQVIGDAYGTVLHLHERDCSTQRRHQKVLEEAPAPTISAGVRRRVLDAAVALARHVGYVNAGTVEFLLDTATDEVYFLEMNTRLQVEHPVTEAITGLDLVELQLRVASGEPLPLTQDEVRCEGHAIEARVYAEDAFGGFLPQAGVAEVVIWPLSGPESQDRGTGERDRAAQEPGPGFDQAVRVDQALASGQEVSTAYDPMLGKVIARGATREEARLALIDALDRTAIFGLTTNTGFLRVLLASEEFREATIDTAWLDRHEVPAPDAAGARALAGIVARDRLREQPRGPWMPDGFRLGGPASRLIQDGRDLTTHGRSTPPRAVADGVWSVREPGGATGFVRVLREGYEVVADAQRFVLDRPDPFRGHAALEGGGSVESPMPGTVLAVSVAEGDEVAEGQTLGVIEAMKMELALTAPYAGTVTAVGAAVGQQVALGAVLFTVEES